MLGRSKRAAAKPAPTQRVEIPALTIRAEVRADSVNIEARTAQVVFSTGAPVERYSWMSDARWIETLGLEAKNIRWGRLNNGAPFLNAHSSYDLRDVIGVVVPGSGEIVKGEARAVVRLSKRADVEPIWQDIQDGIIRNVSVGYRTYKYEQTDGADGKLPIRHAVDWEPYEISAVPIGADAGAQVRSDDKKIPTNPCVIVTRAQETTTMEDVRQEPTQPGTEVIAVDPHDPGAPGAPQTVQAAAAAEPNDRDAGATAERTRIEGIMRAVRAARLPQSFQDRLIREGTTLVEAQDQVLRALDEQTGTGPRVTAVRVEATDPNINVWRGIGNALLHRVSPGSFKLEDIGRPYRGLSLMEVGKVCLQARGIRTTGMSKMEVAGLALGLDQRAGYHTTSDFPNILADVANKTLRRAYDEAPATYQPFSRRVTLPDFKLVKRLQLGEAPSLAAIGENGEFTRGTIGEGKEQFQLGSYGRIFAITRKALINDDTDAFARITQLFGRAARDLESNIVWPQITGNPLMGDGVALFAAGHGNLAGAGAVIGIITIGAGRAAMRTQKGLDAVQFINVNPRFLLVPAALETIADQFVSQNLLASASGNVNPFGGKLTVIAEPRLDAASLISWYLAASTEQIDIVEYAYLEGEEGPMVESRIGFDVDGLEIKCRHDFAAKVIDWRGLYKNPGA